MTSASKTSAHTYLLIWLGTEPNWCLPAPQKGAKHGSWGLTTKVHINVSIKELLKDSSKKCSEYFINHITRLIRQFAISKQKLISGRGAPAVAPALGAFKKNDDALKGSWCLNRRTDGTTAAGLIPVAAHWVHPAHQIGMGGAASVRLTAV